MKLLSFESSARPASVCLTEDGKLIAQNFQCSGLTHSKTLLPMARDLLSATDLDIKDIDAFAVAYGPGSFTGIRIGISTVKGLAWASDKPCVGVSTLEAMAWNASVAGGYLCPVMDARRDQVYNALFETDKKGRPFRLCEDRAISLEELVSDVKGLDSPVMLVGDGVNVAGKFFEESGISFRYPPESIRWQSALGVAMAAEGKSFGTSADLLPVYLRLSQAERERQASMQS